MTCCREAALGVYEIYRPKEGNRTSAFPPEMCVDYKGSCGRRAVCWTANLERSSSAVLISIGNQGIDHKNCSSHAPTLEPSRSHEDRPQHPGEPVRADGGGRLRAGAGLPAVRVRVIRGWDGGEEVKSKIFAFY